MVSMYLGVNQTIVMAYKAVAFYSVFYVMTPVQCFANRHEGLKAHACFNALYFSLFESRCFAILMDFCSKQHCYNKNVVTLYLPQHV